MGLRPKWLRLYVSVDCLNVSVMLSFGLKDGTLAFTFVALTIFVPKIQDQWRQRLAIYVWVGVLMIVYSLLLSVFRMKNGGALIDLSLLSNHPDTDSSARTRLPLPTLLVGLDYGTRWFTSESFSKAKSISDAIILDFPEPSRLIGECTCCA
jgi:hypothetical protein